jgi:hypothetical protein
MTAHTRCNKRLSLLCKRLPVMGARDLSRGSHTPGFIGLPGTKRPDCPVSLGGGAAAL